MADPVIVACPADTWVIVATGVTAGMVWIKDVGKNYVHTYRDTTNPAPTDLSDAIEMEMPGLAINAAAAIDVYIRCIAEDGEVRVDL